MPVRLCAILRFALHFLLVISLFATAAVSANETAGSCRRVTTPGLADLEQQVSVDQFQIYYSLSGTHALRYPEDADQNGIPDIIEDIVTQLKAANRVFSEGLGLVEPLRQNRYKNARSITVLITAREKGNGLAFDDVVNMVSSDGEKETGCTLKIILNRNVRPVRNITPAHELFHLYQYGYTQFKNRWFLEGMARWIEEFFVPLPQDYLSDNADGQIYCSDNFGKAYSAANFWRQRAKHFSPGDDLVVPANLKDSRYKNGSQVVQVEHWVGGKTVQRILNSFMALSMDVSTEMRLPKYHWPESRQRDPVFDERLCRALGEN